MGTPGEVPEGVRRELLTPIAEALVTAGNAPDTAARVTVMHAPARVRVSVRVTVGDLAPEPSVARPGADPVELTTTVSNGQILLETSWPSPPP